MSLPFDPNTASFCEYLSNSEGLIGVTVRFKDGTSKIYQGDEITEDLLDMCKSKTPPTAKE